MGTIATRGRMLRITPEVTMSQAASRLERLLVYRHFSTAEIAGFLLCCWLSVIFWSPGTFDISPIYSLVRHLVDQSTCAAMATIVASTSVLAAASVALDLRPKHWLRAISLLLQLAYFSWLAVCLGLSEIGPPHSLSFGTLSIMALSALRALLLVARVIGYDARDARY